MNEVLKQIAVQAQVEHCISHVRLQEFADLIVRECMHECLRMQLGNQYTPEELLFQTKYRKIIKEHFGVDND
jgi:hypothetical protein